jgi:phage gpG-like protein
MKSLRLLLIAALTVFPFDASAKTACYAAKQAQAEHLLRLHSELMVITVTCRQSSEGRPLTPAYTAFTRKNIGMLKDAENTMMSYYKSTQKGNPVEKLDRLRTMLGNEYGQKVAVVSAPAYCGQHRDKVAYFAAARPSDIASHVHRMQMTERSYASICGKAVVAKRGR